VYTYLVSARRVNGLQIAQLTEHKTALHEDPHVRDEVNHREHVRVLGKSVLHT